MKQSPTLIISALLSAVTFALILWFGLSEVGILPSQEARLDTEQQEQNEEGSALPQLELTTIYDEHISTTQYSDNNLIVNFWASWCAPCIREFPLMLDYVLDENPATEQSGETLLIAISNDQKYSELLDFVGRFPRIAQNPDRVKIIWDPRGEISREQFNVVYLPESFFVRENRILGKKAGEITEQDFQILTNVRF